jgi:NTP pyrophosphatase (non-canonical NTP hydrolase)
MNTARINSTGLHHYTMNEYQADAAETMIYKHKVIYSSLGLANESGEVLGKIKKLLRDDDVSFTGFNTISNEKKAEIADELGDVLWYLAALARDLNLSLNDIAAINLEKLKSRKKRGVLGGSGDKR